MKKFDQAICTALSSGVTTRYNLRGFLNSYRNCDDVWTLVLNNVELKDNANVFMVDKVSYYVLHNLKGGPRVECLFFILCP